MQTRREDAPIRTLADVAAFAETAHLKPDASMSPRWSRNGCQLSINNASVHPTVEVAASPNATTGHNGWRAQFSVETPASVIAAAVEMAATPRPADADGER